jgi:peptide/nickel transport system substrate-binding protein
MKKEEASLSRTRQKVRRRTGGRAWALTVVAGIVAAVGLVAPSAASASSGTGGTLIIGMTAGNIPPLDTVLSGSQGYEGYRFVGFQLYDGLTGFNLLQSTETPPVVGDLATSWTSSGDGTTWTFKLRPGVTFQDGTKFDAASVMFNFNRYYDTTFKYYDAAVAAEAASLTTKPLSWTATGPMTVKITLSSPDAHYPDDLTTLFMASPAAVEKEGNAGFGAHPVGTGPFEFSSEVNGQELILKPFKHYWAGAPKLNELVLKPIPDATARIAALRSGQVNWIEYPTPDDIAQLKSAGFNVLTNSYDHIWMWFLNTAAKPWNNVLVRQAANYAINRQAMATDLLHGTADPAYQVVPYANAAYNPKAFGYDYDPAKAKALLKEAGYPHGFTTTVSYPTSGSGNMIPGPMMEYLQQEMAAVGITINLEPIQWASEITDLISGQLAPGSTAMAFSDTFLQEASWEEMFYSKSPINLSHYSNPTVDADLLKAQTVVNTKARYALYTKAAAIVTKQAPWLFVVNDRNPRALAPTVHGFIEPKSWFVNLRTVWVS